MRKAQKLARASESAKELPLSDCADKLSGGKAVEGACEEGEEGYAEQRKYATSFWNEVGMLCSRNAKVRGSDQVQAGVSVGQFESVENCVVP